MSVRNIKQEYPIISRKHFNRGMLFLVQNLMYEMAYIPSTLPYRTVGRGRESRLRQNMFFCQEQLCDNVSVIDFSLLLSARQTYPDLCPLKWQELQLHEDDTVGFQDNPGLKLALSTGGLKDSY